ncbi:ovostatin-like isoform X2 [Engystomops pustulosus]|uniref:ovostatin-like isoform X2 n=1 Tax=Engystomops pustulosus TaxID=76066 RepID=UPI003AFAC646
MWWKSLPLSIALLGLIMRAGSQKIASPPAYITTAISNGDPIKNQNCRFLLSVPTVVKSGMLGQVCVVMNCIEPVEMTVIVENQGQQIVVIHEQISANFFDCGTFLVPVVSETQYAYVTLTVTGATVDIKERKSFIIDIMPDACRVQMGKNLYQPGDTVRGRLFCFDYDLKPMKHNVTKVYLVDPNNARIVLISVEASEDKLLSVEVSLNEDAHPGTYHLRFERESGDTIFAYINVQRYSLPRYDSTVKCQNTVSVLETSTTIEISAEYVYDKPLPGSFVAKCCRRKAYTYGRTSNCFRDLEDICVNFNAELESGSYTKILDLSVFNLPLSEYQNSIECEVTVREKGTGVLDTKYCYISITSQPASLQFVDSSYYMYYKPGLPFHIEATLSNEKSQPITYENISIAVNGVEVKIATTDDQGKVECLIDTTPYSAPNITISISYFNENQCYATNQPSRPFFRPYNCYDRDYPYAEMIAYRYFSESHNFVQIIKTKGTLACHQTYSIEVEYIVTEDGVGEGVTSTQFYYMVKTKEEFVLHGTVDIDLAEGKKVWKGSFTIDLSITPKYSLNIQLFVFGFTLGEIISDTQEFSVESCTNNEVSARFTEQVVEPGAEVKLEISAAPGSTCGVRAWDSSLELLGAISLLFADDLYNAVNYYQSGFRVKDFDLTDPAPPCEDPNKEVYCHGRYYKQVSSPTDGDAYGNFERFSIIFITNHEVRKPTVCGMEEIVYPNDPCGPIFFARAEAFVGAQFKTLDGVAAGVGAPAAVVTVRKNFADGFAWLKTTIGPDGKGSVTATCPQTITTWNGEVLCVEDVAGVGISNGSASFTTSLDFFTEVTYPPYCTRGETILIDITAVNYQEKCVKVEITLELSDSSVPKPHNDISGVCVCNGQRVSMQWSVHFTALGDVDITATSSTTFISTSETNCDGASDNSMPQHIDTVIKPIHVESEGIRTQVTSSHLVFLKGSTMEYQVTISIPEDAVPDSFTLHVQCIPDIIGPLGDNLVRLVLLPDGCCQQNLARLLPVCHYISYLQATSGIDNDLLDRSKNLLIAGYARQLGCRRNGGEYSLFRNSLLLNSWVTADTFYAFECMQDLIFIDTDIQQETLAQLGRLQNLTTGCISPIGSYYIYQDGKNTEVFYSAYLLIRLTPSRHYGIGDTLIEGLIRCLENVVIEDLDMITIAHVFHAAAVAKISPLWENARDYLMARMNNRDGGIFWLYEQSIPSPYYFLSNRYTTADVVITANAMLGFLMGSGDLDLDFLAQISYWLCEIQGGTGGWTSTVDTIVVVEALTIFGKIVYVENINVEVTVTSGDNVVAHITATNVNRLVLQRVLLPGPGTFSVSVAGVGNPQIQFIADFHRKVSNDGNLISLTVTTEAESCTDGVAPVINITVCATYTGEGETNMVYFDVKILTGYSPNQQAIYDLVASGQFSEYGLDENHVYLYLEKMKPNEEICFSMECFLDQRAMLYSGSSVIAADFYNSRVAASQSYSYPCAPNALE